MIIYQVFRSYSYKSRLCHSTTLFVAYEPAREFVCKMMDAQETMSVILKEMKSADDGMFYDERDLFSACRKGADLDKDFRIYLDTTPLQQ